MEDDPMDTHSHTNCDVNLEGQPDDNPDERKRALAKSLAELDLAPVGPGKVELARPDAVKLPLGEMTSLGVGLSSLSKVGEQLYRVKLPAGATLKQAKDGLFSSSATLLDGSPAWAKFEQVAPGLVFDPTAVAVAAALAQINQKLDGIQDSIDRMFGYLRTKDKAADLAALDDLKAVLDEYRYNLDNAQFKRLKLALVQDVNSHAQKRIRELQAHLSEASHKKGLLELRGQAADATAAALDDLKDYQLAVYLYSFSSFLGVMLLENYDEGYLAMKAEDIREKAREYRKAYTACFDAIESRNRQTLDSYVLGGISAGLSGLGHLVEMTIFADATDIDEALADAARDVDGFNEEENNRLTHLLAQAKDPGVRPFAEGIDAVNRVYNRPYQVLTDGESVYVLPEEGEKR